MQRALTVKCAAIAKALQCLPLLCVPVHLDDDLPPLAVAVVSVPQTGNPDGNLTGCVGLWCNQGAIYTANEDVAPC